MLASATTGDDQTFADWLRTECSGLNARQQQRVAALFAADEYEVFTRGSLAALEEDDVVGILSPLPLASRRVVAAAAASLRTSHAAKAHSESLRTTGPAPSLPVASRRRILEDSTGAPVPWGAHPRWGQDPSVASCSLGATWQELRDRKVDGTGSPFETGGLGGPVEARFGVWVCEEGHVCANGTSAFFCFVFDEVRACPSRESSFIDNLLVRTHFVIVMIWWTGLASWEFEFPFPGSLISTFLVTPRHPTYSSWVLAWR